MCKVLREGAYSTVRNVDGPAKHTYAAVVSGGPQVVEQGKFGAI